MQVTAGGQNVLQTLQKGQFHIPDYQRDYDWGNDELTTFWDDIEGIGNGESYFIGHMVFEGDFHGTSFNVIDGQQRITTITILLCGIRDSFLKLGENDLANYINDTCIYKKDRSNKDFLILNSKMPFPVLQKYIQAKPSDKDESVLKNQMKQGEKNVEYAYKFFMSQINGLTVEELKILRDKIFDLELIFIAVSNEVDAFTVFETLNAKGKDLRSIDLIKNQIFKLYPSISGTQEPESSWKKIKDNIEGNEDVFLNNFWAALHGKVSDRNLYRAFIDYSKKELKNDKKIKEFVKALIEYSDIYYLILNPSKKIDRFFEEYFILEALSKTFGIKVIRPFLLVLINKFQEKQISQEFYLKALRGMERFHFIYHAILNKNSRGLDGRYAGFARKLNKSKNKEDAHVVIRGLLKFLNEKLKDDTSGDLLFSDFKENFDKKVYYSDTKTNLKARKFVFYFLTRIELIENKSFNLNSNEASIEHLLSQSSLEEKNIINNIGNLFLLENSVNSKIGDKDFSLKKEAIISKTNIQTTKQYLNSFKDNQWGEKDIIKRKEHLLKKYYNDFN